MQLWLAFFAVFPLLILGAPQAFAHGSHPEAFSVFLPAERPDLTLIATNYGTLSLQDNLPGFRWQCERDGHDVTYRFSLGAGATPRMYELSSEGLFVSDDLGCQWHRLSHTDSMQITVLLPDKRISTRFWTIERDPTDGGQYPRTVARRWQSESERPTVTQVLLDVGDLELLDVDSRGDEVFVAAWSAAQGSVLFHSQNAGIKWDRKPIVGLMGPHPFSFAHGVVSVPGAVVFRRLDPLGDQVIFSSDAGTTAAPPISLGGFLRGAASDQNGRIFFAVDADRQGSLVTVGDHFELLSRQELPGIPRDLAFRDRLLYLLIGGVHQSPLLVSSDGGASFQPYFNLTRGGRVQECLDIDRCVQACASLVSSGLFDDNFCRDWPGAFARAPKQEVSKNFSCQLAETRRGVARPTWLALLLLLGPLVLAILRRHENQK